MWLVARYAPRFGQPLLDGQSWQRTVAGLLYRPGFTRRQGPGSLTLFGSASASGVNHEIDGAAASRRGSFIVECKATAGGITKGDAALFDFKVMDFYQKKILTAARESWWRFLCGTTPTQMPARTAAISLGLLICDPGRLPLPVLFRAASMPAADMYLPEPLLQEIVRLGERALCPQQERWPYRAQTRELTFKPGRWSDGEIADLLWVEDELSACVLDLYESHRPGMLESLAIGLLCRARKAA